MPNRVWAVESVSITGTLSPQIICLTAEAALAVCAALIGRHVTNVGGVRVTVRPPLEGECSG